MIENAYTNDNYDTNLLVTQLRPLEDILNLEKTTIYVLDRKEKMENIKKIISSFLSFIAENNYSTILSQFSRVNDSKIFVESSLSKVNLIKKKINFIKEIFIINTCKVALKKQKMKNLKKLNNIITQRINKWLLDFNISKQYKKSKQYAKLFNTYANIQNEILSLKSSNISGIDGNKLKIFDILIQKLKNKMEKIKLTFDNIMNSIFIEKKTDLNELFTLFCTIKVVQFQNNYEEFLNFSKKIIKNNLYEITKKYLLEINKTVLEENNKRYSNFKFVSFTNDFQLLDAIKILLKQYLTIAINYNEYIKLKNESELYKYLFEKRKEIFDYFEKKITKLISIFYTNYFCINNNNYGYNINKNNLFLFLSIIIFFSECIQYLFMVNDSNFIKNYIENLVVDQITNNIKIQIRKAGILLSSDFWKRIPLQDNNEIFSGKVEGQIIQLKYFFTFFNSESKQLFDNYKNSLKGDLVELFYKYCDSYNNITSFEEYIIYLRKIKFIDENRINKDFCLFNKNLENSKLILSTSSFSIIKSIIEMGKNIVLFPSLSKNILNWMFCLFDYYFLASINLLMIQKSYIKQIFETININDVIKKNTLITSSEFANFLGSMYHLRKQINKTIKNLSVLYNSKIDIFNNSCSNINQNDEIDSKLLYFPKLNSQIVLNPNNIFCLLIESIVIVESNRSIYKTLKKFKNNIINLNNNEFIQEIDNQFCLYKSSINELRLFLFKPLCVNLIKLGPFIQKFQNQNWDISERDNFDFTIESPYISGLIQDFIDKREKLNLISGGSLTNKSIYKFLLVLLNYVIEKFMEAIALIKKISSNGRSILLKDIKFMKQKIVESFKDTLINCSEIDDIFNKIILYINSLYYNKEELLTYIKESKLAYKFAISIISKGDNFINIKNKDKGKLIDEIDNCYFEIIKNINNMLINNN